MSELNLCHYKVKEASVVGSDLPIDLTGDGLAEGVALADVEVSWKGRESVCKKIFQRFAPFQMRKSSFDARVIKIDSLKLPGRLLDDARLREKLGIEIIRGDHARLFGRQKVYLKYPSQNIGDVKVQDLQTANIFRFKVGSSEIGLGRVGAFVLESGKILKGVFYNVGFMKWGVFADRPIYPANSINVYIYTEEGPEKVDLSKILSFIPLNAEEFWKLVEIFEEDHLAVSTMIEALAAGSK